MLNWIVKGLIQWLYGLLWQIGEYIMNALMDVFSMDMEYFKTAVPVSEVIMDIMFGVSWALFLGNLVFQAAKSMMTGIGFEGEDPRTLATRTIVFSFLLVCSRQICEIGLSIGAAAVDFLQIPSSVILPSPDENMFSIDASWFLMIIVGLIILFQLVKFFFEVGERYVIVGVLTILSPLAFAMGGSRNTMDIFKGWARMYGSMCLMLVMNVVFMKLLVSAMAIFPRGLSVFPWLILIIALARVARKIDSIVARIGLNPAITGDGLGRGIPGMMAVMVGKSLVSGAIGGKTGALSSVAGAVKSVVSGSAPHHSGFAGGSKPAPSPVNTNTKSAPHPFSGQSGSSLTSTATDSMTETSLSGGVPVNPPLVRTGLVQQGNQSRTASTKPSSLHSFSAGNNSSKPMRGIAVSADDVPAHRDTSDNTKAPRMSAAAPRKSAAAPFEPLDTRKTSEAGGQEKPTKAPRGSGAMKPADSSGAANKSISRSGAGMMPAAPTSITRQTQGASAVHLDGTGHRTSGAGGISQLSPVRGSVSPVQNSASVQHDSRTQVSSALSQGGTQVQSNAHTSRQGAQVQQSIQNPTRSGGGAASAPVQTQIPGAAEAGTTQPAPRQRTASAPTPTAMQPNKPDTTARTPKAPAKASREAVSGESVNQAKAKVTKPKAPDTKKRTGKVKVPTPVDIGTDSNTNPKL